MLAYRTFRPPHLLSDGLREFLRTEAGRDFTSIAGFFPCEWEVVVMGGLLRDLLLGRVLQIEARPVDIDLVLFGAKSIEELRNRLWNTMRSSNSFGGFKCRLRINGAVFDLWRAEDHTNIATASKPHTVEQILRHNLLDVDAIAWDPRIDVIHDYGCMDAIEAGRIGMMGPQGVSQKFLANQIAHVLLIGFKTNFVLAEDVCSFVAKASATCRADVRQIVQRKRPKQADQIELFWNDLLSGGNQRCPAQTRASV